MIAAAAGDAMTYMKPPPSDSYITSMLCPVCSEFVAVATPGLGIDAADDLVAATEADCPTHKPIHIPRASADKEQL